MALPVGGGQLVVDVEPADLHFFTFAYLLPKWQLLTKSIYLRFVSVGDQAAHRKPPSGTSPPEAASCRPAMVGRGRAACRAGCLGSGPPLSKRAGLVDARAGVPVWRKPRLARGGGRQVPGDAAGVGAAVDHRHGREAAPVVERDRRAAGQALVGDAVRRAPQHAGRRRSGGRRSRAVPGRAPHGRRVATALARGRRLAAWSDRRRCSTPVAPPVSAAPARSCAPPVGAARRARDVRGTRIRKMPSATAQAATRSGRGPENVSAVLLRGLPERPARAGLGCSVPFQHVPLFLAPTGLADGLALKESRYAWCGDSPLRPERPRWFPRSPDAASGRPHGDSAVRCRVWIPPKSDRAALAARRSERC